MTKQEFVNLNGRKAYEILIQNRLGSAKYCHEPTANILDKIHKNSILPMLRLLGLDKAKGILQAKEALVVKQQSRLSQNSEMDEVCDLPLTRQALASAMVRFFDHPGNIIGHDATAGGLSLISSVVINQDLAITINEKTYSQVSHIGLYWDFDLLTVTFKNDSGQSTEKALAIDGVFQFEVVRRQESESAEKTGASEPDYGEDFLSQKELEKLLRKKEKKNGLQ